jgi:hypothetical protein
MISPQRFGAGLVCLMALGSVMFALAPAGSAQAQTVAQALSPGSPARSVGTVKAIAGNVVTLTTDAGSEVNILLSPSAVMVRTAPGHKDLQGATPIQLQDVKVGDRMLVRGKVADDGKSIAAASGVVMKQEDIAQKQDQEREDWNKRGLGGVVKSVDAAGEVITISTGSMAAKTVSVHVSKDTILRRYSPDSVKFDDAKAAPLSEIKAGDQLRARGDRSADGSELTAEEVVSGTFRNIAGVVAAVDASNQTVTVTDLLSKKPVSVRIGSDSQLRKLPPPVAQMIATRLKGQGPTGTPAAPGQDTSSASKTPPEPPADGAQPQGSGTPGNGRRFRAGGQQDFQQMLNRMPPVALSDLQKGDAVILLTTEGSAASAPTAITLLTGVEPILSASPLDNRAAMSLSPWSLGAPTGDSGP